MRGRSRAFHDAIQSIANRSSTAPPESSVKPYIVPRTGGDARVRESEAQAKRGHPAMNKTALELSQGHCCAPRLRRHAKFGQKPFAEQLDLRPLEGLVRAYEPVA